MPCRDDRDEPGWDRGYQYGRREVEDMQQRLDKYAQMLCETCRILESENLVVPKAVRLWWKQHKKADAARKAEEQHQREQAELRRKALKKLTEAERVALNIEVDI